MSSVTPRGMSVQEAYREFRDGNFRVNRRYQRKLVWTTEEKEKLIDSLLKGFPIPLFLLAVSPGPSGGRTYDIIDGMQRLNAIFGFIENVFSIGGKFFDIEQLSRARQLAQQGLFQSVADPAAKLSAPLCADFLDYQLAVTEFPNTSEDSVNEVFGRINSYGRHLSDQERRQAGVVTMFATTVRELAAQIRGDVSSESVDLAAMPEISIRVEGTTQTHGILADDTFWCKQGVLRKSQLRESEDEQFIADLAISILREQAFGFSGKALDDVYAPSSQESNDVNTLLAAYGSERLKSEVQATLSLLRGTIEAVDPGLNALRKLVNPGGGANPIKTAFYAIFMAYFDLCVRQHKTPVDHQGIMKALDNLQGRLYVSAGAIKAEPREGNVKLTKGLIQDFFEDTEPPAISKGAGTTIQFENAIRRSKTETAAFECKQGILALDGNRKLQPGLLDKIVQTLCGIANIGPTSGASAYVGALFIGVTDSDRDKDRIEKLDKIKGVKIGSRFCVGIDRELPHLGISLDRYKQKVVSHISASRMSPDLKAGILANIDCITYKSFSVIAIWVPWQRSVSSVDDAVYSREGSNTVLVEGFAKIQATISRFRS